MQDDGRKEDSEQERDDLTSPGVGLSAPDAEGFQTLVSEEMAGIDPAELSDPEGAKVEDGLKEHEKNVRTSALGNREALDDAHMKPGMTPCANPDCKQPTWQEGLCLKCRIDALERQNSVQADAIRRVLSIAELAVDLQLRPTGLRLEAFIPHEPKPATPTEALALIKHLCWCCYQMGCGQDHNWPPTEDQVNSQRDAVKFQVATLAKTGRLDPMANHNNWMKFRLEEGWSYGEVKDVEAKTHPDLIPYDDLPEVERMKDEMDILAFTAGLEVLLRRGGPESGGETIFNLQKDHLVDELLTSPGLDDALVRRDHGPESWPEEHAGYTCPICGSEKKIAPESVSASASLHFEPCCNKCGAKTTIIAGGTEHAHIDVPFHIEGHIVCKDKKCRHTQDIKFHVTGMVMGGDTEDNPFPCLPCGGEFLEDTEENAGLCGSKAAPANAFCENLLADEACPIDQAGGTPEEDSP